MSARDYPMDDGHTKIGDVLGDEQETWPLVIEKAYAKLKGGYDKINDGGSSGEALEAL
ncbi:C2 family cysteine protease [Pyrinomonas sp.]|uniref:C2 family cysteine protease n=1 Tax=Pyrinomonas sp. TaxID=2080306 RepID=UPI003331530C